MARIKSRLFRKVTILLNFIRHILLACWFGAALFFAAVVAPAAFDVLRSFELPNANEIAGGIVTQTLAVVNVAGFVIALFLLLTALLRGGSLGRWAVVPESICLAVLALATGVGHWVIAARLRALRAAMVLPMDQVAGDDPQRMAFLNLHAYSVKVLGLAMIAALVALALMARNSRNQI